MHSGKYAIKIIPISQYEILHMISITEYMKQKILKTHIKIPKSQAL